ncbi:MAG: hypothetical protein ACRDUV_23495 [Pseudonocardiaceae bacterium]
MSPIHHRPQQGRCRRRVAVTLAELSAGPHHAEDPAKRARRMIVLHYQPK